MAQEADHEGVAQLRSDIHQMCQQAVEMLKLTWEGFKTQDLAWLQQAERLGRQIHQQEKTLTTAAVQQAGQQVGMRGVLQGLLLTPVNLERKRLGQHFHAQETTLATGVVQQEEKPEVGQGLFLVPVHLERIGDHIALLVRALTTVVREGIPFTERAVRELNALFATAIELLECVRDVLSTQNRILIHHLQTAGRRYEALVNEYALSHQQRLIEGLCLPKASSVFVALLDHLKGIESHIAQIADKLAGEAVW